MHRNRAWTGLALATTLLLCFGAVATAQAIEGIVFLDENGNGSLDGEELAVAGAVVSDGVTVVQTDESGAYALQVSENARFVYVSIPSGTQAVDTWYYEVEGSDSLDFALASVVQEGPLVFAQVSDIHYAPTPEEFALGLRDRTMVILPDPILSTVQEEIEAVDVDFVLVAGDIAADSKYPEPEDVDRWIGAMSDYFALYTAPVYALVGNHDVIRDETIGKTIYEDHFGPTHYSFDVKGVHFVVLDTQELVGTRLVYGMDEAQLAWLEADLKTAGVTTPIVVFCHEPTYSWVESDVNTATLQLLEKYGITALLSGHWHTNVVLREEPFYEFTSGAVCGAWWEGTGADGTGFGYRVFRMSRGVLDSIWRTGGVEEAIVPVPSEAVLTWEDDLVAKVWGKAIDATYRWDDGASYELAAYWNGLWSLAAANLNVSILSDGYHTLTVSFAMEDGRVIETAKSYFVSNPQVTLEEIIDHEETYQGKIVAAPELAVRAVMGGAISAYDDTKTIIIDDFPFSVARGDIIAVMGMYHPTATAPLKNYDPVYNVVVSEDED